MSVQETSRKIEELSRLRSRRRKWLAATSLCVVGIVAACLWVARNAAVSLLQDGPTHDEFVARLTTEIARQVIPQVNGSGVQASYGTLPLPETATPVDHNHASLRASGAHRPPLVTEESPFKTDEKNAELPLCSDVNNPQKPLGRYREQMVSEYQTTATKIVNDLTTIRGAEENGIHSGLSVGTIASLFISHIQDGLPGFPPGDHSALAALNSPKDSR